MHLPCYTGSVDSSMDYSTNPVDKVKQQQHIASQGPQHYPAQHFPPQSQLHDHQNVTAQSHQQHDLLHDTSGDRSPEHHFLGSSKHQFNQQYTSEMFIPASSHIADVSTTFAFGTHTTSSSMYQSYSHENSSKPSSDQHLFHTRVDNQSPLNILSRTNPVSTEVSETYRYHPESQPPIHSDYPTKSVQHSLEHVHGSYSLNHHQPIIYPEDMATTLACSTNEQPVSYADPRAAIHASSTAVEVLNYSGTVQLDDKVKASQGTGVLLEVEVLTPDKDISDHMDSIPISQQYSSQDLQHSKEIDERPVQYSAQNDSRKAVKSDTLDNIRAKELAKPVCPCTDDLNSSDEKNAEKYICGGCFSRFITICLLHEHIKVHGIGGSYHFDHVSQTAYPKYDTFCSFTQTEDMYQRPEETSTAEEVNVSCSLNGSVLSIKHLSANKLSSHTVQESPSPVRKSRKRKQDHPKPSKIRVLEKKKNERSRRAKKRNESKKKKGGSYYSNEDDTDNDAIDDDMIVEADVQHYAGSIQSKESSEKLVEVKEEIIDTDELGTKSTIAKPLKKRGRPKKVDTSVSKNVPVKRKAAKKAKKLITTELSDDIKSDNDTNNDDNKTAGNVASKNRKKVAQHGDDDFDLSNAPEKSKKHKPRKNATKYQMCDICGLPVPTSNYQYHMRVHTGEKPFICEKCGKAFAHRRFLVKHMLTHAVEKPWKCNLCSAQFCQKSEYRMHMNGHEGVRPHECRVCGMKFLSKAMLNTHQANVHMGITRFECSVCSRRFFKRSSLNVHQATHYEATMKCNFCDRKFKDRAGLKRHERIHTGEKRFQCHVCNHGFIQSTPYWVHMEKRHQMDRETVKNILAEIRETNKRSGIRTQINVLPADVDQILLSKGKANSANDNVKQEAQTSKDNPNVKVEYANDRLIAKHPYQSIAELETLPNTERPTGQKYFTDIKVPNLYPNNDASLSISNVYSQGVEIDTSSALDIQQQYRFLMSASETTSTPTVPVVSAISSNHPIQLNHPIQSNHPITSQPGVPSNNLQSTVNLGSLNTSLNPLHQHGFIGMNTLQHALDYSSSLPPAGTYTDISRESVNNPSQ